MCVMMRFEYVYYEEMRRGCEGVYYEKEVSGATCCPIRPHDFESLHEDGSFGRAHQLKNGLDVTGLGGDELGVHRRHRCHHSLAARGPTPTTPTSTPTTPTSIISSTHS